MTTPPPTTAAQFRTDAEHFQRFKPGEEIGYSDWLTITQPMIDQFGAVTLDPDPMHVDPAWARAHGPYEDTIAFGFLTASLLTHLLRSAMEWSSERSHTIHGYYLNYGFDRLRLVSPVAVNHRVRGHFRVIDVRPADEHGRVVVRIAATIGLEDTDRPAAVAEWLTIWIPPSAAG